MPFVRPTYAALQTRIAADLAAMPAVLREPLSAAWARACHGQYGYLEWIDAQCSPLTCEAERLADWAVLYSVPRLAATSAAGTVTVKGTPGASLLAGAQLRSATGVDYTSMAAIVIPAGGSASVGVRCAVAGAAGNAVAGAVLTLVRAVAGITSATTVVAPGLSGGAEAEMVESWRARVASEWQARTQSGGRGGRVADYVYWAQSAHPSVSTAIVSTSGQPAGRVLVLPVCNTLPSRMPTAAVLAAVIAAMDVQAPALADVVVEAPGLVLVSPRIHLDPAIDTAALRTAISTAIGALLLTKVGVGITAAELDAAIASVTARYTRDVSWGGAVYATQVPALSGVTWT